MQYIILDLEATCEQNNRTFDNEIIEIGAVKINEHKEIVGEFVSFVKPTMNPKLSDFCKGLTTITQDDVDNSETFDKVLEKFLDWVGPEESIYVSWGFYDKKQFIKDCDRHKISKDWLSDKHISLKHQHYELVLDRKGRKPMGMSKALSLAGLPLVGVHHRGIDDARNISQIFLKYYNLWDLPK